MRYRYGKNKKWYIWLFVTKYKQLYYSFTHRGQETPYGDKNLSRHFLWHQVITWTNVDLSLVGFCGIHLIATLQWGQELLICKWLWILYIWYYCHIPQRSVSYTICLSADCIVISHIRLCVQHMHQNYITVLLLYHYSLKIYIKHLAT